MSALLSVAMHANYLDGCQDDVVVTREAWIHLHTKDVALTCSSTQSAKRIVEENLTKNSEIKKKHQTTNLKKYTGWKSEQLAACTVDFPSTRSSVS